jgi:hypothetical protein
MDASTRGQARVTSLRQIPSTCGAFVTGRALPYPHFPASFQDGKEGVDCSSPSEGFGKPPQMGGFFGMLVG